MNKYLIVVDIPGFELKHVSGKNTPNISKLIEKGHTAKLKSVFPAVTCTVQASLLSGSYPNQHGIISNGLYDRENHLVSFWEQASYLVQKDRIWDVVKSKNLNAKTAVIFWQNTMYSNSDIVLTPRPLHMEDHIIMWCYSKPPLLYENISSEIGKFDLTTYWGPMASQQSSEWIGRATTSVLERERPNILFTYIPHLDYVFQREGISPGNLSQEISFVDHLVGNIIEKTVDLGIRDRCQFVVLSEYGFTQVNSDIPLNRILREQGLLKIREIQGKEFLDYEYSTAFAMVDHQIAHIYLKNGIEHQVKEILDGVKDIDLVLDDEGKKALKINHMRSGDLIAISKKEKWFSYYWWFDDNKSPPFANRVDIHRKPGYDPSELFIDNKTRTIPLNGRLIKASHGRLPSSSDDQGYGIYVSDKNNMQINCDSVVDAVTVGRYLIKHVN